MEDMDYAKPKKKFNNSKKRIGGETEPELSSEEERRTQFRTIRNHKTQANLQTIA
jgi:hypothetical protein